MDHTATTTTNRSISSNLIKFVLASGFMLLMLFIIANRDEDAPTISGAARSGKWQSVRAAFLKTHPCCELCGKKIELQVHHVIPFHIDPSRELDETNLITLCADHHFLFGHLLHWDSYNPHVREDVELWRDKIAKRARAPDRGKIP